MMSCFNSCVMLNVLYAIDLCYMVWYRRKDQILCGYSFGVRVSFVMPKQSSCLIVQFNFI